MPLRATFDLVFAASFRLQALANDPTNSTDLVPERRLVIFAPKLLTNSVEENNLPTAGALQRIGQLVKTTAK